MTRLTNLVVFSLERLYFLAAIQICLFSKICNPTVPLRTGVAKVFSPRRVSLVSPDFLSFECNYHMWRYATVCSTPEDVCRTSHLPL